MARYSHATLKRRYELLVKERKEILRVARFFRAHSQRIRKYNQKAEELVRQVFKLK